MAEAKVEPDAELNDGRRDFRNLRDHYEGIGVHAVDITKADNDLQTLFYAGEKPPHMWWEDFEKRLTKAFTTYVKKEGRIVHSEDMKLRTLLSKIKADFLKPTKASIEMELTAIPMVMTYSRALLLFRNEVSKVHPPQMNNRSTRRNINQVDSGRGRSTDVTMVKVVVITMEVTPVVEDHIREATAEVVVVDAVVEENPIKPERIYVKFKPEDKEKLRRERDSYKDSKRQSSHISELQTQLSQANGNNDHTTVGQQSQITQVTTGSTMMGGTKRAISKQTRSKDRCCPNSLTHQDVDQEILRI
eukprot:scaffold70488_cov59-Attheya_sp.AAC.5